MQYTFKTNGSIHDFSNPFGERWMYRKAKFDPATNLYIAKKLAEEYGLPELQINGLGYTPITPPILVDFTDKETQDIVDHNSPYTPLRKSIINPTLLNSADFKNKRLFFAFQQIPERSIFTARVLERMLEIYIKSPQ